MRQYMSYAGETLYIASPACFYHDGYTLWEAWRGLAEYHGIRVLMPTRNALDLTHEDLRLNANAIFDNCALAMNECTAIIADLEAFRGTEPDGGTLFELGMAYARGLRAYGFTRDRRPMIHKVRTAELRGERVVDASGRPLAYGDIPFCPSLMGTAKIIEGRFEDALQLWQIELDEAKRTLAWPTAAKPAAPSPQADVKAVFLFSPRVYEENAQAWFDACRERFASLGLRLVSPLDPVKDEPVCQSEDPLVRALHLFERWQRQVRACNGLVVDLNDFNGYEPSGDAAILSGMAWQLGKPCVGFMADTRCMQRRIPHFGPDRDNKDQFGNNVENFNYPINLMFSGAMPIIQGGPEEAIGHLGKPRHGG